MAYFVKLVTFLSAWYCPELEISLHFYERQLFILPDVFSQIKCSSKLQININIPSLISKYGFTFSGRLNTLYICHKANRKICQFCITVTQGLQRSTLMLQFSLHFLTLSTEAGNRAKGKTCKRPALNKMFKEYFYVDIWKEMSFYSCLSRQL